MRLDLPRQRHGSRGAKPNLAVRPSFEHLDRARGGDLVAVAVAAGVHAEERDCAPPRDVKGQPRPVHLLKDGRRGVDLVVGRELRFCSGSSRLGIDPDALQHPVDAAFRPDPSLADARRLGLRVRAASFRGNGHATQSRKRGLYPPNLPVLSGTKSCQGYGFADAAHRARARRPGARTKSATSFAASSAIRSSVSFSAPRRERLAWEPHPCAPGFLSGFT